jgi:MoxR-like ATPase
VLPSLDEARFLAAARRFTDLFADLRRTFAERDDVLTQISLALLSREHVLMTGPPGSAKSGIASSVLKRIVDETTGQPSVFARQFTESTVQTDLVGPINFKTLMETGRTEHFTDEGMLGAVHAFLDEVFDGRDMLLRSTLNVLQERELKQGGRTTRGRIECAILTSNRYLAEVLESSRETLLAFVDRIAFVSFVPKGFANPESLSAVLKKHVNAPAPLGGALERTLTIQDLDVLQAAVDATVVPDEICDLLVDLLGFFDEEAAAAERADASFIATRYLSTRTAVRIGRILRALCVLDRIQGDPERPLEVRRGDLEGLRYALLLCGPKPEEVKALLQRETDPRERRQLSIVRTEREIFDRVIKRLPPALATTTKHRRTVAKLSAAQEVAGEAAEVPTKALVDATLELAQAVQERTAGSAEAARALERAVRELCERALKVGLVTGTGADALGVDEMVAKLTDLAATLERSSPSGRPLARWLRGRAARVVDEAARLTTPGLTVMLGHLKTSPGGLGQVLPVIERCLGLLEALQRHKVGLAAAGADADGDPPIGTGWTAAVDDAERDVATAFDAGFRGEVEDALSVAQGQELGAVLDALSAPLAALDAIAVRFAALRAVPGGPGTSDLKRMVVGPRIRPLVETAFGRIDTAYAADLVTQVERLLRTLHTAGLGDVLSAKDLLGMTAAAVVRCSTRAKAPNPSLDRNGYRKLREAMRAPGAFTLLELALHVAPALPHASDSPSAAVARVAELARDLPDGLSQQVAAIDLERLDRTVTFFERWFAAIDEQAGAAADPLAVLADSGFFQVTRDERALFRFSLETRLVSEVFPWAADHAAQLRTRLEVLEQKSQERVRELLRKRADAEWARMLQP